MKQIHAKTHRVTIQIHDFEVEEGGLIIDVGSITYENTDDLLKTLQYVLRKWAGQFGGDDD